MKYLQVGNGSAFNHNMVNSAFLIEIEENNIMLFDCGYSVYGKLRELDEKGTISLSNMKSAYISHLDDDHMGSLKTLIYFMYFVKGITIEIYAHEEIWQELGSYLDDMDSIYEFGVVKPRTLFHRITMNAHNAVIGYGSYIRTIHTDHGKPCYGLEIAANNSVGRILISGDTRPTIDLADYLEEYPEENVVFHDYSDWNEPGSQVHTCKHTFENIYSKEIRERIKKYHNDAPFESSWITVR